MKIRSVVVNSRQRSFKVRVASKTCSFPYARCAPRPTSTDRVARAYVDPELGNQAFTYVLESGREGSVPVEQVLDYNRDPSYLRDLMVYRLTLEAQNRVARSGLSKREIIRRLRTSPAQLYRLLDQTNRRKSVDQLVRLLGVLNCDVKLVVRAKSA